MVSHLSERRLSCDCGEYPWLRFVAAKFPDRSIDDFVSRSERKKLAALRLELSRRIEQHVEHGFVVGRLFPPMLDYNRLSIGALGDMERFADTLREFRRRGWV